MGRDNKEIECYRDSRIKIIVDRQEPEGYIATIDSSRIFFPRGTLREVAIQDRDEARRILENLFPFGYNIFTHNLTHDSLIAAATKAYHMDEERIRKDIERAEREEIRKHGIDHDNT